MEENARFQDENADGVKRVAQNRFAATAESGEIRGWKNIVFKTKTDVQCRTSLYL